MKVEIMDTTLRDGEQTSGVSFSPAEKLHMARYLLEEIRVNRIEVASALVSEGEFESIYRIVKWAGEAGYMDKDAWARGLKDIENVSSHPEGTFFYTWFKGVGVKQ